MQTDKPTNEVAQLELFSFKKKWKRVVRQIQKRKKRIAKHIMVETTETTVMDVNEMNPVVVASAGVDTAQANEYNILQMVWEAKDYKKEIAHIKKKVEYDKAAIGNSVEYIEYAL